MMTETIDYLNIDREAIVALAKNSAEHANVLLHDLKEEREKFTESNKDIMHAIIDILVEAGIYPPLTERRKANGLDYYKLVDGWGEDWHIYRGLLACPHCHTDLRDPNGPPFKLEMGVEIRGLYDGVAFHQCPKCEGCWSRQGTPLTKEVAYSLSKKEIFTV